MKTLGFVQSSKSVSHVSGYALASLEQAIAAHGVVGHRPPVATRTSGRVVKFLNKAGGLRSIRRQGDRALLIPMMGLQESLLFPWTYSTEVIPVIFDCMPHQFEEWATLFRRNRIVTAFFTASMVVEHFRQAIPSGNWLWLPEAVNAATYNARLSWTQREIDVLEFGRRFGLFHDTVKPGLQQHGVRHVYEKVRGELVFPSRDAFTAGLASSRISVCFPQSLTHPERFGQVETLTQRYLESMASGTIILGASPSELQNLCGYDPVVAVDWTDPVGQILRLLREPEQHEALRQRNLEAVRTHGAWDRRASELLAALADLGYVRNPDAAAALSGGGKAKRPEVLR